MRKFLLKKLVRDKIYANMLKEGQKVTQRRLNDEQYLRELKRKLLEEAQEYDPKHPKAIEELADLMEVIESLSENHGQDFSQLRQLQLCRRSERGGFEGRNYIELVELDDQDPWADYYQKEPDRFKEIK